MTNPLPHFAPLIDRLRYAPETVDPVEVEDIYLLLQKFVDLIDDHSDNKIGLRQFLNELRKLRNEVED